MFYVASSTKFESHPVRHLPLYPTREPQLLRQYSASCSDGSSCTRSTASAAADLDTVLAIMSIGNRTTVSDAPMEVALPNWIGNAVADRHKHPSNRQEMDRS